MIGFHVVNLLVPADPQKFELSTPSGKWEFDRAANFEEGRAALQNGQCAHTYAMFNSASMADGAAVADQAFDEVTPILLGASFLTGLSVTVKGSTSFSECKILGPNSHWPRERAMGDGRPIVRTEADFVGHLERFVAAWGSTGQSEKALLLVHHWLDALACWSLEDLYLSVTTLLQIIVATQNHIEGRLKRKDELDYYDGVAAASARANITAPGKDFKDMRDELIHDGRLIGKRFQGPDIVACAEVTAEVLNWFDSYMFSAFQLATHQPRFRAGDFVSLNAYSI